MRLLILSPFYPPHIGGLETHALEFNQHLASSVEHITVFTPRLPATAPASETHDNITVLRFPAFELIHNYPIPRFWQVDFWKSWHEALANQPTHILSRTRFFFTSLIAWYIARAKNLPWLHVEHGSDFVHFHSPLKSCIGKLYDWVFGRAVLRQADKIVANSQASTLFVARLSGRNDCQTIYRGVEIEKIINTSEQTEIRNRFPDQVVIGYLGRLIDGKGVIHILEALNTLRNPRLACVIIGSGPERAKLESYIKEHSLENSVILLGHRPLPEALSLMRSIDIFINPSYSEGIPTSVIEAAIMKKAIIATDVGGTPEIITGDGDGFLVTAGDILALAEKLKFLVDDEGMRQSLGEQAYNTVRGKFSWPNAIQQYLEIFKTLSQKTK